MAPSPAMACEVFFADAVPNLAAAVPSLTANTDPYNTPPATGSIVVAQAPAGVITTNTGRTNTTTQNYLIALDVEGVQQGRANPNTSPVIAGIVSTAIQYYRWW